MSHDAHHRAAQLAASLSTHDDVDGALRRLTDAAVRLLPGVDAASITLPDPGTPPGPPSLVAATGELATAADAEQRRLGEGPALLTVERCEQVVSGDLAGDDRFPVYGPAAAAAGVGAQVGLVLDVAALGCPSLNLYARTPRTFDDTLAAWASVEPVASAALRYAHEIEHLRKALDTRTLIGQATGRVMERYAMSPEAAFALLTRLSSTRNVKLRELAAEVVAEPAAGDGTGGPRE